MAWTHLVKEHNGYLVPSDKKRYFSLVKEVSTRFISFDCVSDI